ncbi:MAG: hypothetical protein IJU64_07080 [Bacilli bacterium]|nr:hypothetical protein [Bacilli bacterium]
MDSDFATGAGHKQGEMQFDVTITKDGGGDLTADILANVAGNYTVKATASGGVKLSLTKTEALGTDSETPAINFGNPTAAASGALGSIAGAEVDIMVITISDTGAVSYNDGSSHTWALADLGTAVQSKTIYYGLEVKNSAAEASGSVEVAGEGDNKITPSVE